MRLRGFVYQSDFYRAMLVKHFEILVSTDVLELLMYFHDIDIEIRFIYTKRLINHTGFLFSCVLNFESPINRK